MAPRVQYSATFRHGPVSGPVNGFLGAVLVTVTGRVWNILSAWSPWFHQHLGTFPFWAPAVIATLGVLGAALVGVRHGTPMANIVYRVVCWTGAGVWTTVTIQVGPSLIGIILLAGGALFAGVLAPVFAPAAPLPATADGDDDGPETLQQEVLDRVVELCNLKPHQRPTISLVRDWDRGAGHTFRLDGRRGTTFSWRTLRNVQLDLATSLQLPDGCPVQAEPAGTHQGAALLKVSTRNYLAEVIDYPTDYSPTTLMTPDGKPREFSVGQFLDAAPSLIELYQAAGLAFGQRGGGKTVLLHNLTATMVRCTDVLVWHIDLNGGGMASPWSIADVAHPAVDWVATTDRSALRMANAALRIAKARKARYQHLLVTSDTDVLPISPRLPAIILFVDETAEVAGEDAGKEAQKVRKALQELQRIGRAMCVHVFFSAQRATADYLPAQVKKGGSVVFCARVADEAELAYAFDWHAGIDREALTEAGQFFIQRGSGPVKMMKGFGLRPRQIGDIVAAVQPIRAQVRLDDLSVSAAGDDYSRRWQDPDTVAWLNSLRGGGDTGGAPFDDDPDPGGGRHDDLVPANPGPDDEDLDDMSEVDRFRATMRRLREGEAKPTPPVPTPRPPDSISKADVDRFLDELDRCPTFQGSRPAKAPTPTPDVVDDGDTASGNSRAARRRAIVDFIARHAGEEGCLTGDVVRFITASGLTSREATVKEDLGAMRTEGMLTQVRGGQEVRARWWVA